METQSCSDLVKAILIEVVDIVWPYLSWLFQATCWMKMPKIV